MGKLGIFDLDELEKTSTKESIFPVGEKEPIKTIKKVAKPVEKKQSFLQRLITPRISSQEEKTTFKKAAERSQRFIENRPLTEVFTGKSLSERGAFQALEKSRENKLSEAIRQRKTPTALQLFRQQLPEIAGQAGIEFADITPLDAGVIAASMGIGKLPIRGTTIEQIVKRIPVGKGFFGRAKELGRLEKSLRTAAITSNRTPFATPHFIERTVDVIDNSIRKAKDKLKFVKDTAEIQLVDRFAPIRHFVAETENIIGKPVNIADDPFVGARLYAGVGGKIKQRLDILGDILKPERKNLGAINEILKNERFIERSNRGFLNPKNVTTKIA